MRRTVLVFGIVLLAGGAIALWLPDAGITPAPVSGGNEDVPVHFPPDRPLEARILDLERAVSDERQARQLLQEEVMYLTGELDALRDLDAEEPDVERASSTVSEGPASANRSRRSYADRNSDEQRVARLVATGMSAEQAEWVVARESRYQLEMLQARHAAERSGNYQQYRELQATASQSFRAELGPDDYERYLEGTGRPTAVAVASVLDASPAQAAGLRPGDEIRRYAGQRIYNMGDLNRLTLEGVAGEMVYAEVLRDGQPMQIALPRGPVGIMSGGRRRR